MNTAHLRPIARRSVLPAALAIAAPLAAQDQAEAPAPATPAGEAVEMVSEPVVQPLPAPSATPTRAPAPRPAATPAPVASAAPEPAVPETDAPAAEATPDPLAVPAAPPSLAPAAPADDIAITPFGTTDAVAGESVLPAWWPWAAAALAALLALAGGIAVWRNRASKVLRLAAPLAAPSSAAPVPDLPRIDVSVEITAATRSVMMFTLQYRLNLANRTDKAVSDLSIAVQLASARRGGDNAPSAGAAHPAPGVARIGPHQSRSVTGEIRLPLNEIAILQQGSASLFIPLLHVTLEGEGQSAQTRSFVIGTPTATGSTRLHPILLDTPPGSIPGLMAQPIAIPPASDAA